VVQEAEAIFILPLFETIDIVPLLLFKSFLFELCPLYSENSSLVFGNTTFL